MENKGCINGSYIFNSIYVQKNIKKGNGSKGLFQLVDSNVSIYWFIILITVYTLFI